MMNEELKTPSDGEEKLVGKPVNASGPDDKSGKGMKILGFNLLAFALYTILGRATGDEGLITAVFLAGIHTFVCVVAAIATRKWVWMLAGLMVLVIGFGTCVAGI